MNHQMMKYKCPKATKIAHTAPSSILFNKYWYSFKLSSPLKLFIKKVIYNIKIRGILTNEIIEYFLFITKTMFNPIVSRIVK